MISGSAFAIAIALWGAPAEGIPAACRLSAFRGLSPDLFGLARQLLEDPHTGVLFAVEELGPKALDLAPAVLCASRGCCRHPDPDRYSEDAEWGGGGYGGAAVSALSSMGSAALPALIRAMESIDDEGARMVFARVCDEFGAQAAPAARALARLLEASSDERWGDRFIDPARDALIKIGPAAVKPMLEVSKRALRNPMALDPPRMSDVLVYWAYAGVQSPDAARFLFSALPRSLAVGSERVILLNIEALGKQGRFAAEAVRMLEEARNKATRESVRSAADRAIEAIQTDIAKGVRPRQPGEKPSTHEPSSRNE